LRQSTSKKQLKILKFEEKIPAFSARLSALITFCKFLKAILFFIVVTLKLYSLFYFTGTITNWLYIFKKDFAILFCKQKNLP
jgi:hypothetical protein